MAPFANGTEFADMLRVKELVVAGANAAAELMIVAKKEAVFMIEIIYLCVLLDFGNESSFSHVLPRVAITNTNFVQTSIYRDSREMVI